VLSLKGVLWVGWGCCVCENRCLCLMFIISWLFGWWCLLVCWVVVSFILLSGCGFWCCDWMIFIVMVMIWIFCVFLVLSIGMIWYFGIVRLLLRLLLFCVVRVVLRCCVMIF